MSVPPSEVAANRAQLTVAIGEAIAGTARADRA